jgi:hypothetical protein
MQAQAHARHRGLFHAHAHVRRDCDCGVRRSRARYLRDLALRAMRHVPLAGLRRVGADTCYNSVTVSGAEAVLRTKMGAYAKVAGLTQGGRPVYQQVTNGIATVYLFYWPSMGNWLIGNTYTSSGAYVKSSGNNTAALCPDQATGWQAVTGGAWVSTYPIVVAASAAQTTSSTTLSPTGFPTATVPPASGRRSLPIHGTSICRAKRPWV